MISEITILHTPGCPHSRLAQQRIGAAVAQLGGSAPAVIVDEIADPDEATRRDFHGSPALIVDGVDLFAAPADGPAFACRTYATDAGREGCPSVAQIVEALMARKGR